MSIRDPSDGSVREKPIVGEKPVYVSTRTELSSDDKPLMSSTTSGLRAGNQSPEYQARLDKSRKWLEEYFKGKRI